MPKLKDRNKQIPNGFKFLQPETGWTSTPWASFSTIVRQLRDHRTGNPYLAQKHNWNTDDGVIADEVDAYNAAICQAHGWKDYIIDGSFNVSSPDYSPPVRTKKKGAVVQRLVRGGIAWATWLGTGRKPVEPTLSEARAQVCVKCPLNRQGNWIEEFEMKAAEVLKTQIGLKNKMDLKTSVDDRLGICDACGCPMELKVHADLEFILQKTDTETKAAFDPLCWILSEESKHLP